MVIVPLKLRVKGSLAIVPSSVCLLGVIWVGLDSYYTSLIVDSSLSDALTTSLPQSIVTQQLTIGHMLR
jgi:hypothetical protein